MTYEDTPVIDTSVLSVLILLPVMEFGIGALIYRQNTNIRWSRFPILITYSPKKHLNVTLSKHFLSFFLNRPLLPCGVEGFFTCESIRQLVGLLGRVIGLMQGLYLHTGQHNTEKRRQTSMSGAGFEPAISTFERPKTVLVSDRSAIETGPSKHKEKMTIYWLLINPLKMWQS
jgi:hypothetical protein